MKALFLVSCFAALVLPLVGWAADGDVKERLKQRSAAVEGVKQSGAVGETVDGFLASRLPSSPAAAELISAENDDRRLAYAQIAKETGAEASFVGKRRAAKELERASSGTWWRQSDGRWTQKP
jgi:uncharacterized protein YdbL (DUF1318 family)